MKAIGWYYWWRFRRYGGEVWACTRCVHSTAKELQQGWEFYEGAKKVPKHRAANAWTCPVLAREDVWGTVSATLENRRLLEMIRAWNQQETEELSFSPYMNFTTQMHNLDDFMRPFTCDVVLITMCNIFMTVGEDQGPGNIEGQEWSGVKPLDMIQRVVIVVSAENGFEPPTYRLQLPQHNAKLKCYLQTAATEQHKTAKFTIKLKGECLTQQQQYGNPILTDTKYGHCGCEWGFDVRFHKDWRGWHFSSFIIQNW